MSIPPRQFIPNKILEVLAKSRQYTPIILIKTLTYLFIFSSLILQSETMAGANAELGHKSKLNISVIISFTMP